MSEAAIHKQQRELTNHILVPSTHMFEYIRQGFECLDNGLMQVEKISYHVMMPKEKDNG